MTKEKHEIMMENEFLSSEYRVKCSCGWEDSKVFDSHEVKKTRDWMIERIATHRQEHSLNDQS